MGAAGVHRYHGHCAGEDLHLDQAVADGRSSERALSAASKQFLLPQNGYE